MGRTKTNAKSIWQTYTALNENMQARAMRAFTSYYAGGEISVEARSPDDAQSNSCLFVGGEMRHEAETICCKAANASCDCAHTCRSDLRRSCSRFDLQTATADEDQLRSTRLMQDGSAQLCAAVCVQQISFASCCVRSVIAYVAS